MNKHMFWELLKTCFSGMIEWSEGNTGNSEPHLYFNEESNYSEENTWSNDGFRSTIHSPL